MENLIMSPIREQDERFLRIQELIETKRKFLYNKQNNLRRIVKQNQFLEAIKSDYETYFF